MLPFNDEGVCFNSCEISFNEASSLYLDRLGSVLQDAIVHQQMTIEMAVQKAFPGAHCTSGFRSPKYNASVGGKPESFHLYGMARDYRLCAGFPTVIAGFRVVREHDHFHVEFSHG